MKVFFKTSVVPFSITFLFMLPLVFLPFLQEGRSFVWQTDGLSQHYPVLLYYGEVLRGLIAGKGFPMVDFRVGMGFDTLTTLNYYAIGDPIALLSVFMTKENGVIVYGLLILLRFYLAGISFLVFVRYHRLQGMAGVLGALMYVFCGYSFFTGVRHPYFLNPMIYLPLLLIGAEEQLRLITPGETAPHRRKYSGLFIVMSFISAISNFYFLYILTILVILYIIFRYATVYSKKWGNRLKGFLITGLKAGSCYLLGLAMAAAVFLPVVYLFLQNGRMDTEPETLSGYLFYSLRYYYQALLAVFTSGIRPTDGWLDLSFTTIVAVSFVILFCNRRKRLGHLRLGFLLCILGMGVPAFGSLMNGFSYVTNRWDFFAAFAVAVIFTVTYRDLFRLGHWEKVLLVVGVAGYGVLAMINHSRAVLLSFVLLFFTAAAVLLLQTKPLRKKGRLQNGVVYAFVVVSLCFNGYVYYSGNFKGYVKEFPAKEKVDAVVKGAEAEAIYSIQDDGFYRVAVAGDNVRNEALTIGYYDVSAYYSLIDGNVTDFYKQLELAGQISAFRFDNQDNRTILDTLACVKYYVAKDPSMVPYGYDLLQKFKNGSETYYLYENRYALPLGYTYDSYMLREDYDKLDALQKQNALLYSVVLDEDSGYASPDNTGKDRGLQRLDFTLDAEENVILVEGQIKTARDGKAVLELDGDAHREIYIRFENLRIERHARVMRNIKITAEGEKQKSVNIRNQYHASYFGKKNYLINLGYRGKEKTWISITFPNPETYDYDEIAVYQLSMDGYREQVEKLRGSSLENVVQGRNRLEGDVTLGDQGIMVLSIPYSKGWSAQVDGKEAELLQANVMYCGLELTEGVHHITLTYETPYLRTGIWISCAAWILFVGIIIYYRKKPSIQEDDRVEKGQPETIKDEDAFEAPSNSMVRR